MPPNELEFRILGPLEVLLAGAPLPLRGHKQRLLLALLLLNRNTVVSTDRLIDDLWAQHPPATASAALQMHVTHVRRALRDSDVISTHPGGYAIEAGDSLDLARFERLFAEAAESTDAAVAVGKLEEALDLWRGPPLGDLAYEPALEPAIARLEELRLSALEQHLDAELELGRHGTLIPQLETLVAENPFRESFHQRLMLALYRSGRQGDALAAYQTARVTLAAELGVEPGSGLRRLERAILAQAPELELPPAAQSPRSLVVLLDDGDDPPLLMLGQLLARAAGSELLILRAIPPGGDLRAATAAVNEQLKAAATEGLRVRAAALASAAPDADVARLARRLDVELLLAATEAALSAPVPCDVAVAFMRDETSFDGDAPVLVPFGGGEHDWAAVELAAQVARATGAALQLAAPSETASVALADASLAVQYALGVVAEPVVLRAGAEALLEATATAGLVVAGVSDRWRAEGIGPFRKALARDAHPPVVLVRQGPRPSALAPRESLTRFTWSVAPPRGA